MKFNTNTILGYMAPEIEICEVTVEKGFLVSENPDWIYGNEGAAGSIEDGNSYDF